MLNGPQYKFAAGVATGLCALEAYQAAYPNAGGESARRSASRLMTNADVEREVAAIRASATGLGGVAVMALLEKRQFIARLVRARLMLEPETSDLWQEFTTTEHGTKRKLYDKLRAIALDNDLAGDGSEAFANAALGTVAEAMARIRASKWNRTSGGIKA